MPFYDFKCVDCNYVFEDLRKVNDDNPRCNKCDGITIKLISRMSVVVQGSENRSLDCIVGADSEKRWKIIDERKKSLNRDKKILKEKD